MIYNRQLPRNLAFLSLSVILGADLAITEIAPLAVAQTTPIQSSVGKSVTFTCNDSEATIKAKNGPKVTTGSTTIYIGYQQVSSTNKDPRLVRFDNGVKRWCLSNYETTGDDGSGYGLLWDGGSILYGVFSSTGTQTGNNFGRFAIGRWLTSYGSGGGPKVAVIARIDPTNGSVKYATFLTSKRPDNGKTNSLLVTSLLWNGTNLTVRATSWWTPRRTNTSAMNCSGSSPYQYTAVFTSDLKKMNSASAATCS